MYRRRRPQHNKIAFSFDSFLDLVTNVIGIIIRLILVSWVGARAYTAAMLNAPSPAADQEEAEVAAAPPTLSLPGPRPEDDPQSKKNWQLIVEVNKAKDLQTQQIKELKLAQSKVNEASKKLTLADVEGQRKKLAEDKRAVEDILDRNSKDIMNVAMSKEELLRRARLLQEEIKAVEKLPAPTKVLRYHTPVSRPVREEELHFECIRGRVAFIDVRAFIEEITDSLKEKSRGLETSFTVAAATSQIGDFRLRYVIERERAFAERFVNSDAPSRRAQFNRAVTAWTVEPVNANRGETIEAALAANSAFRQVIDGAFSQQSVVTLWVYPDSFTLFRQLRDFLHQRDLEVAARPIPMDMNIGASREGTASRGQ